MTTTRPLTRLRPRPWLLWTLALIIAATGLVNLALAADHIVHADRYRDLHVAYPIWLRVVTALGWGGALLLIAGGLIRRRRWAQRGLVPLLSNYGAFGVLWLVIFAETDFSRGRIAFQALLTAIVVGVVAVVMRLRRVRRAFAAAPHRAGPTPTSATDYPDQHTAGERST